MGEEPIRQEKTPSMLRRCFNHDYRAPGIYQITLTLADRASQALGRLVVRRAALAAGEGQGGAGDWLALAQARGLGLRPEEIEAKVELSALGEAIFALWRRFGEFTPEIKPLFASIMPDHLHLILEVTRPMARPLGNAIGGFKTGCERVYRELSLVAQNRGASPKLFSPGYQDTILYHRGQLDNMFNYLRDNPRRRAIKALFPDLFRVVGELRVELKLSAGPAAGPEAKAGLAPRAVSAGPEAAPAFSAKSGAAACPVPRAKAPGYAPEAKTIGCFAALGNRFLLDRPLAQAQVSRSFFGYRRDARGKIERDAAGEPVVEFSTPEFAERRERLFALAREGAVIISPCVSHGERELARQALKAGYPLVTLQNKGFSKLQKPTGRYFDACSEGRLLMLAPAAWPYQPGEKPMSRFDATAMNRLAQWLAGDGAAEINYHGMKPANIDALALAAVKKVKG